MNPDTLKGLDPEVQQAVIMGHLLGQIMATALDTPAANWLASPEVTEQCEAWEKEREEA